MAESDRLGLLIDELGRAMGMSGLALDAAGYCSLVFDDKVVLTIARSEGAGSALLYVELGIVPEHARADLVSEMLQANAEPPSVPGGMLGLNRGSGTALLLARPVVSGLSYLEFEALVEGMVNAAVPWIDRVALAAHGVAVPAAGLAGRSAVTGVIRG